MHLANECKWVEASCGLLGAWGIYLLDSTGPASLLFPSPSLHTQDLTSGCILPALLWQVQHHQPAGQAAFNTAYFLQSSSSEGWPRFCFHRRAVLIQVLSTSQLCINLFKNPSETKHFDCEQINLGDCLVFVQSLGQWVSTLGINIVENVFTFLAEGPSLSNHLTLPSHLWLGSAISTVLIPRSDPLLRCLGK